MSVLLTALLALSVHADASTSAHRTSISTTASSKNLSIETSAFQNPIFSESRNNNEMSDEPTGEEPDWSRDLLSQYSEIRIKVFPHNSKYNSPQGKDTVLDKVTIGSAANCNVYKADRPTSEGGITRNTLIKSGTSFNFNTINVKDAIWVECAAPVQVTRADFASTPIRYKGVLFVKPSSGAVPYLTVVNVLPFEEYLKGVVPSEMPASWAFESLKAQAIAARTYAFYELTTNVYSRDQNATRENSGAQFDDTVTYQAYLGLRNTTAATDKAVDETAGQVMSHQGKVVKAYFHADSGGYTENAENVWGKYYPYIIGKPELYPPGSIPGTDWASTASFNDIETKLIANNYLAEGSNIKEVRIEKEDHFLSSRPSLVTLILSNNETKKVSAVDFYFAMRLKSAWFTISSSNGSITMNGKGFGHGAGMNQWGAKVMVDKLNKNFEEILKFYYTGVDISAPVRN